MKSERHGLVIGIERTGDNVFLSLKAQGMLTHQDYETLTPMIDSVLAEVKDPKVKVLFDGAELDGWEPRAAWDDFKIGLKHGNEFEKIALCGNKKWLKMASKIGSWFVSGEMKYFDSCDDAIDWLK